jgi:type IV secretory pathway TrbL component
MPAKISVQQIWIANKLKYLTYASGTRPKKFPKIKKSSYILGFALVLVLVLVLVVVAFAVVLVAFAVVLVFAFVFIFVFAVLSTFAFALVFP